MICSLASVAVGVLAYGQLYTACIYRCPYPSFWYHYPYVIRVEYNSGCPRLADVGKDAK
ncbi:hypothetical protein OAA13_00350 [Crocinitomicaceae bacterium]|jgi:hypothetical protein|nr:hypothetical protein [Crocinitomicaceae bacterium]